MEESEESVSVQSQSDQQAEELKFPFKLNCNFLNQTMIILTDQNMFNLESELGDSITNVAQDSQIAEIQKQNILFIQNNISKLWNLN